MVPASGPDRHLYPAREAFLLLLSTCRRTAALSLPALTRRLIRRLRTPPPAVARSSPTCGCAPTPALHRRRLLRQRPGRDRQRPVQDRADPRQGPWRTVEQVELATLEWVWWWNTSRLHSELGYRTPLESETDYYAHHDSPLEALATQDNR